MVKWVEDCFFWFCEDDVDEEHDDGDVVEYP